MKMKKQKINIEVSLPDKAKIVASNDWVTYVEKKAKNKDVFVVTTLRAEDIFCNNDKETIELRKSEIIALYSLVKNWK